MLASVRAMVEPSAPRISLAPSLTLVIVNVSPVKVWPDSMVLAVAPLNRVTGDTSSSVNVGLIPVAVNVGVSLTSETARSALAVVFEKASVPPPPSGDQHEAISG